MFPQEWRDITATQRDILVKLKQDGPLTNIELVEQMDLSQPATSDATRALRDRGLIEREEWGDRGYPLGLTDRGRNVVVVAADVYREAI